MKNFYMDKAPFLGTRMVVRSLDVRKKPFFAQEDDKEILGPQVTIS
jgi:hypothetical protein